MPSVIDEYVAEVGHHLCGPARMRRDMLAEIRDSLTDAADAGEDDPTAGFGAPAEIAAGLQELLVVADARRTAGLLVLVIGSSWALTEVASRDGWAEWDGAMPGAGYLWLARAVDLLAPGAVIAALVAMALLGWGVRHLWRPRELARLCAGVTMGVVTSVGTGAILLTVLSPHGRWSGTLWWAAPFAVVLLSAVRSWQVARA